MTVTLEAITLTITSTARTWRKMEQRHSLYFTADMQLSCENLFKRFMELLLQIKHTWN